MILDLFKLDNQVAVVTGGRRGLGRAMAKGLAEAGADVVVVSQNGNSDETRQLVEQAGRRFLDLKVDLGKPDSRKGLIDTVVEKMDESIFLSIMQATPIAIYPKSSR